MNTKNLLSDKFSRVTHHSQKNIITNDDLSAILTNIYLLDQRAHYIVTKDGNYDDSHSFQYSSIPERIKKLENAYKSGQTILIKELEHWNSQIEKMARYLGKNVNVHLYLSPPHGSGFNWHTDDRDVTIILQQGEKKFEVQEPDGSVSEYFLKQGSELYIPFGATHRAMTGDKASVHLSFGSWPSGLFIRDHYESYPFSMDIFK